jgi:uncharacterized alkaline shock family protein YloU
MSSADAEADTAVTTGEDGDGPGRLTIAPLAVERMATRAITECGVVGGTAGRLFGISVGEASEDRDAEVSARLHGESAVSLSVRCSVAYPTPVRATAQTLREYVAGRIGELTGMRVQRVDVTVVALPSSAGRRVR